MAPTLYPIQREQGIFGECLGVGRFCGCIARSSRGGSTNLCVKEPAENKKNLRFDENLRTDGLLTSETVHLENCV